MANLKSQRGFTLVELSISVVIMGLLVGAALASLSWIDETKVISTVSQVQSYTNAVALFRQLYIATPGDFFRAGLRIRGCPGVNGAACNPIETPTFPGFPYYDVAGNPTATTGDGFVGNPAWNTLWGAPATTSTGGLTGAVSADDEKYLFWAHLQLAGLIGGIKLDGLYAATPLAVGITNPITASGGGFVVGYSVPGVNPALTPKGPGAIQTAPTPTAGVSGLVLVQVIDPKLPLQTTAGALPLTPLRAAEIDRKIDDGFPGTGFIQAYGVGASCFTTGNTILTTPTTAINSYNETINSRDCGLIYRISN